MALHSEGTGTHGRSAARRCNAMSGGMENGDAPQPRGPILTQSLTREGRRRAKRHGLANRPNLSCHDLDDRRMLLWGLNASKSRKPDRAGRGSGRQRSR